MVWFKVDDTLPFHAKVLAAGNPAMGLWVRAGAWCAQQLTDGHVPTHVARTMGTASQAAALVKAGLWDVTPGGYAFHDWSTEDRQPTREQVEDKRSTWREKKRRQRAKGTENTGRDQAGRFVSPNMSPGDTPEDSKGESPLSRPVPSRPYNSRRSTSESPVTRDDEPPQLETSVPRHVLPPGWMPGNAHKAYAGERGIDLSHELRQFRLHCRSKRVTSLDWDAEFEKWLGNARVPGGSVKGTTSDRVAAHADLVQRLAAEENNVIDFPQITTEGGA